MRSARLELALSERAFDLPTSGTIAVFRPHAGDDLSALPRDQVRVITGFKPDHDAFAAEGYAMEPVAPWAMALVCLPRARAAARALVAQAAAGLAAGGVIVIDGQKTDGVESMLKDLRALGLTMGAAISKAHGKLAVLKPGPMLAEWVAQPSQIDGGFQTLPGVFSADAPDPASVLLAQALPAKLPPHVADFGAGWGYLSRAILERAGVQSLDLIEAESDALTCAKANISDPRARFHWADATRFKPVRLWDAVVMNPPFHAGRDADPSLGLAFITAAQKGLQPGGSLWLVANRHLPYEPELVKLFRKVEDMGGNSRFRLYHASVPQRGR